MRFEEVAAVVDGVPHMTRTQGKVLHDFVFDSKRERILELGFASGVSTCYMAAALDELDNGGRIDTLDRKAARERRPHIGQLLDRCGLADYVSTIFADTSYTWELMRLLEQHPTPSYDFVFVDGAHTWEVDALAFLLADRMLRPGGWVLFDDLDWTLNSSPTLKNMTWVRNLPEDQRITPQVRKVFELLVEPHPSYVNCSEANGWAWAQKGIGT